MIYMPDPTCKAMMKDFKGIPACVKRYRTYFCIQVSSELSHIMACANLVHLTALIFRNSDFPKFLTEN